MFTIELFLWSGWERFSLYGTMITLTLLFITGSVVAHLLHGGFTTRTLKEKLFLFFVIVVISLLHDLWAGKKAFYSEKHRKIARWLGILNLVLSLVIVHLGVRIRLGL